ncbi:MAG: hypothetical protein AB8G86_05955 [Saprospiraceae bacterium]
MPLALFKTSIHLTNKVIQGFNFIFAEAFDASILAQSDLGGSTVA